MAVASQTTRKQDVPIVEEDAVEAAMLDEFEIVEEKAAKSGGKPLVQPADVGSIRIE
jgi:predicted RNase H-like nuclease (RuvC/YqgF family)